MKKLADVMSERTWFQIGKLRSADLPGVCLAVALAEVATDDEILEAGWRAIRIIARLWPERVWAPRSEGDRGMMTTIAHFNDHWDTTWQDIEKFIEAFDAETEARG